MLHRRLIIWSNRQGLHWDNIREVQIFIETHLIQVVWQWLRGHSDQWELRIKEKYHSEEVKEVVGAVLDAKLWTRLLEELSQILKGALHSRELFFLWMDLAPFLPKKYILLRLTESAHLDLNRVRLKNILERRQESKGKVRGSGKMPSIMMKSGEPIMPRPLAITPT